MFREDATPELLICTFLAMGRILHLQPPGEQSQQVIQSACNVIINQSQQFNNVMQQAALKCIYYTVKFSRTHKDEFNQVKLVNVLSNILDKNLDDKLTLTSLQTLKEFALNGFQAQMQDPILFNSFMRIMTTPETPYYGIILDILQLLVDASAYSVANVVNFGFLRCICNNLQDFRVYKDYPIQSVYDINPQSENGGMSLPRFGSPAKKSQSYLNLYSYGYLDKSISTLDRILQLMFNRQQIFQSFSLDQLEKFKPIVDSISNQLKMKQAYDSYKIDATVKLQKFFQNFRVKTLQGGGSAQDEAHKLADVVCQFLDHILQPHLMQTPFYQGTYIQTDNTYYQSPFLISQQIGSIILVKCIDQSSPYEDNKLFEIPSTINYRDLQDQVNKKYNNIPMQICYIDEQGEPITIDSDLVLQKAIKLALQISHQKGERDVILRLLVHKLTHCNFSSKPYNLHIIEYFQCFECGCQFARDPRSDGSTNCCSECYGLLARQQS